jgi:hypothetical protein
MAQEPKGHGTADTAAEAAREAAKAGELAMDALNKVMAACSPGRRAAGCLARAGNVFTENGFRRLSGGMGLFGDALLVVAEALVLLTSIVAAIKCKEWVYPFYGIALMGLLLGFQYAASRFFEITNGYIAGWRSRIGIAPLPACLAWVMVVAGLLLVLGGIVQAVRADYWDIFWKALGACVALDLMAWALIHPGIANVGVEDQVRGPAEALDVVSFLVKVLLRIVPMVFGFGILAGVIRLVMGMVQVIRTADVSSATAAFVFVAGASLLPVASLLVALSVRLHLGIAEAILAIPARLDSSRK